MTTVFFVEDDESLQDIAGLVFRGPEFAVRIFESAEKLLGERTYPHVYVLDKQLPGISGLDLCRILKAGPQTRNIPVIIVSADPDIKALAAPIGATAVLEKPFSIHVLLKAVMDVST